MADKERKILKLISSWIESDAGFESDSVKLDELNGRQVTPRERVLADLVSQIYRSVHPIFSSCSHPDWEAETDELIKNL